MSSILSRIMIGVGLAGTLTLGGCGGGEASSPGGEVEIKTTEGTPNLAYVTNMVASFWVIAEAGAQDAAEEFDATVDVRMPPDGLPAQQKAIIENLLARGVDGIAISPLDPANQTSLINDACRMTNVITHDSDAPETNRLAYVGMDNYTAGRMCGKLVKEAMPDGGSVMLFVGRVEQLNARLRRQGVIDELLDRPEDLTRFDEPGSELRGDKYTILDTRTDQGDSATAKSNAEAAIARYPDLGCMVGLFAYNPPACLSAVRGADKLGEIEIVAFDEDDDTLQGIEDGHIHGTVVQDPYRYGYESIRILAALARGDESVLPEGGFINVPARSIREDNVEEFRADLEEKLRRGEEAG